ncbi:His Kinase A domain containing protein [Podila epigama]|nr:His Kinase A domain containing protein [Podila epigama]
MAPPPSSQSEDVPQQDHPQDGSSSRSGIFQRRPRFLRAITSPIPQLRDTFMSDSSSHQSLENRPNIISAITGHGGLSTGEGLSGGIHHVNHGADSVSCGTNSTSGSSNVNGNTHPTRPQLHPIQQDPQQQPLLSDAQLRSFSTASALPMYLPSSPSTLPASQSRNSITETLKEHRWSKGLKLNWVPGFSSSTHHVAGLDGSFVIGSSKPSSSSSKTSSQKSIQRRKSEGTGLRISRTEQDAMSVGSISLGLAPISISGKSFPRGNNKSGIETSVDQLKVSEARTRRISDSGLSTSSKLTSSGLAERISGFAQTVRGLSRASFSAGHSTPTTATSSTCSTPSTPGFSPQCSYEQKTTSADQRYHSRQHCNQQTTSDKEYDNWDDFLLDYRQGLVPSDRPPKKPRTGEAFPPMPSYACAGNEFASFLPGPIPPSEERRLRALYSFQILRTGSDPNFERIVHLVATVMGVKACTISLVDHERVYIKAGSNFDFNDVPREESFCSHTVLRAANDPLVILDATKDWRFQNLPAVVSEPHLRFYAGAPLTTSDGLNIGSLCLVDTEPRSSFTQRERMLLVDFAAVVMREMELWNDQVQLCIRNRMMRDVTRWVRGCLDISMNDSTTSQDDTDADNRKTTDRNGTAHPLDAPSTHPSPFNLSASSSVTLSAPTFTTTDSTPVSPFPAPALISPPLEPVFPTPSGSPTLLSCALGSNPTVSTSSTTSNLTGNPLQDKAFPTACVLIQATLNVDAVYLVQATDNQSVMPQTGSSVVWNYLDAAGRRKGSVGVVNGGRTLDDQPNTSFVCLASSKKNPELFKRPALDEKVQQARREGNYWVCTEEGCRPHRLGDSLLNAIEPAWDRDLPIIKEMLGYVRQEIAVPPHLQGCNQLFSCSTGKDAIESDWYGACAPGVAALKDSNRRKLLCHTFQGTVPNLSSGSSSPYQSCVIVPILGPPMASSLQLSDTQPWAYFVILSSSRTKQFSIHERVYLKNFGSCLITEVLKRRVEAADKAKGVFIKSISHELRTPLHIILGILELLYANPEEPLSENQLAMVASAEASGKSLIDTINNIIDLAKLDPDNNISSRSEDGDAGPPRDLSESHLQEIDIRELCEQVAGTMAKACADKNLVVLPSWTKPSLASLSSSGPSSSAPVSASSVHSSRSNPMHCNSRGIPSPDESINGYTSSTDSQHGFSGRRFQPDRKTVLELMVAMDEPDKDPDQDIHWNFKLNVQVLTRILTQLVENAIKFTSTGFVELSAVSPPLGSIPLRPPSPDSRPILFTVRDTGKGISSEFVQSCLFQRFSQEDPLQVGTGLGLALVKLLVENLGGWLEIWSEGIEGKGCVVKVLIWATPASRPTKSLKDMNGAWTEKSCRFYAGEPSVGSDRLWKIMGERIMGQQLNMNIERGDEHDVSCEDMLKNLSDQSACDLLILNDDLMRLRTYLYHWSDRHEALAGANDEEQEPETPTPLLMLTSPTNINIVRRLVDDYLAQVEATAVERPATIVIMTKPIGPIKLSQCLRDCFIPAVSTRGLQTPQGSPRLVAMRSLPMPPPLIRSATVPHISTNSLGSFDSGMLSAGNIMRSRFVFPTHGGSGIGELDSRPPMVLIPPHSPGGLVIPPRILTFDPKPATPQQSESGPRTGGEDPVGGPSPPSDESSTDTSTKAQSGSSTTSVENTPRPRPQRSIRNYMSQRHLRNGGDASRTAAGAMPTLVTPLSLGSLQNGAGLENSAETGRGNNNSNISNIGNKGLPRVLIVEDNITNRMILRTFLKKRGIGVVEAENGKIGVERFQEEVQRRQGRQGFDFVLMDLQMPVMDGNMATKQIREFEQAMVDQYGLSVPAPQESTSAPATTTEGVEVNTKADQGDEEEAAPAAASSGAVSTAGGYRPTIIFALTGLAADEDKRLAFECGVDGYLTKPVSLKTLGSLLSNCLPENMEEMARLSDVQLAAVKS